MDALSFGSCIGFTVSLLVADPRLGLLVSLVLHGMLTSDVTANILLGPMAGAFLAHTLLKDMTKEELVEHSPKDMPFTLC